MSKLMRTVNIGNMKVPAIAVGCRRMNNLSTEEADRYIKTSMDLGANFSTSLTSTAAP